LTKIEYSFPNRPSIKIVAKIHKPYSVSEIIKFLITMRQGKALQLYEVENGISVLNYTVKKALAFYYQV